MIELKNAINSLLKSMEETMNLCDLSVVYPEGENNNKVPFQTEEDKHILKLSSEKGAVKIEISDGKLSLLCASEQVSDAKDEDYEQLSVSLFEYKEDSFDVKDVKSTANEICESIENYFGKSRKFKTKKVAKKSAKKGGKNDTVTYEPENLATRVSNIYPELKDVLEENSSTYETTLVDDFFKEHANKYIVDSIKNKDKQKIKRLFNAFNTFYEEGPKDTQSLIAVTILGINFKDDDNLLFENADKYMDENLKLAVISVIRYLSTSSGKKDLNSINNPKPYVKKKFKKK